MKTRNIFILIICISFFFSCSFFTKTLLKEFGVDEDKRKELIEHGKKSEAEVNKVEDNNVTINKNPQVKLYVTVKPEDGDEFDAVITAVVSRVNIPRKGDIVTVYYNPKDKTDIILY